MTYPPRMETVGRKWLQFGCRTGHVVRSHDGLATLKRRAFIRAASLWVRPINALVLVLSIVVLLAGENAAAIPYLILSGLLLVLLETGAEAPARRREARIICDIRPLLLSRLIQLPETKRAGRIVRARPKIGIPELPPDRPRTRVAERRPAPEDAYFD